MRTTAALLLAIALALPLAAQTVVLPPIGLERWLVPISVADVSGANGSVWTSELWAINGTTGAGTIVAFPCVLGGSGGCPTTDLPSGRSVRLPAYGTPAQPGVIVVTNRPTSLTLHVRDKSRASQSWGAEIPVVRVQDFHIGDMNLTGIPAGPAWRQTLRIYTVRDLPTFGETFFNVRLYSVTASGDQLVAEREYRMPEPLVPPPNQIGSPLAQITITDVFAQAAQHERVRVTIEVRDEPLAFPPTPYWAFVSVTNNETQEVATVTPR